MPRRPVLLHTLQSLVCTAAAVHHALGDGDIARLLSAPGTYLVRFSRSAPGQLVVSANPRGGGQITILLCSKNPYMLNQCDNCIFLQVQ